MGMLGVAAGAVAMGLGGALARDDAQQAEQGRLDQARQASAATEAKALEKMQRQSQAMRAAVTGAYADAAAMRGGTASKLDALLKPSDGAAPHQQGGTTPLQLLGVQFAPGSLSPDQLAHLQDVRAAAHAVLADKTLNDRARTAAIADLREEAALLARAGGGNAEVFGGAASTAVPALSVWGPTARAGAAGAAEPQERGDIAGAQATLAAAQRKYEAAAPGTLGHAAAVKEMNAASNALERLLWQDEARRGSRRVRQ
jgi:hypothetical protein